jgi:thiamine-phosphate pyrophosphorylase
MNDLYAIIDLEVADAPIDLAERVLASRCSWLQLRAKNADDRTWLEVARALRTRCGEAGVPFVVNDRPDIATIVGADALHLGQDDLPIDEARRIVGNLPIGCSTHDLAQARAAEADGADLIAFGPVFDTRSKANPDPTVGLERLREVCATVSRPVIAIGGITPENAPDVRAAGADYLAAISALPRFLAR